MQRLEDAKVHVSIPEAYPPSGEQSYSLYRVVIKVNGLTWSLTHRYSRFKDLHSSLKKRFGKEIHLPDFPKKKVRNVDSPEFVERRRLELQYYLQDVVQMSEVVASQELDLFLGHREYILMSQSPTPKDREAERRRRDLSNAAEHQRSSSVDPFLDLDGSFAADRSSRYASASARTVMPGDRSTFEFSDHSYPPTSSAADAFSSFASEHVGGGGGGGGEGGGGGGGVMSKTVVLSGECCAITPPEYEHPLHRAAAAGDTDQVARLLDKGDGTVHLLDSNLQSPLHAAAVHANAHAIFMLLERGANPNLQDKQGWTPLHCACKNGKLEAIIALLNTHIKLNVSTNEGLSALHFVAGGGSVGSALREKDAQVQVMRQMIDLGADPSASSNALVTPLHECAASGNPAAIQLLLQHNGVVVDALDANKDTPLHHAIRCRQHRAAQELVFAGANLELTGRDGAPLPLLLRLRAERGVQMRDPLA